VNGCLALLRFLWNLAMLGVLILLALLAFTRG
jgi:hypothetical protein